MIAMARHWNAEKYDDDDSIQPKHKVATNSKAKVFLSQTLLTVVHLSVV